MHRRWHRSDRKVCQSGIRTGRRVTLGFELLEKRPIIIAIAGSNGASKSAFFASHLANCGLLFVNADNIALELVIGR
jgi:UDP-N-acetylmuramoylalanine-D-glutamate ligase